MTENYEFTKKRLIELANRSYAAGIFTFSDFLGLDEQSAFAEIKSSLKGIKYTSFGGAAGATRIMLRFGDEVENGYSRDFPITLIKAVPKAQKWADKLTHRDILGAIMSLGTERALIGDIIVRENEFYIFVHSKIAEFITENLNRAKHTDLILSEADSLPEGELFKTEMRTVLCNSPRIDAVVAKLFCLSREEANEFFKRKLVFVDGRLCENNSRELSDGETVSVRTKGKFIFRGEVGISKKGKLNLSVELFI